jgi:hypothetical protein
MTTCLEFRRRVGAEPAAADPDFEAHRRECSACGRFQDELRAMDGVIRRALEVNLPPRARVGGGATPARRTRFFAIAASLAAGATVALFALVAIPRAAIAREVVAHIGHEPDALTAVQPLAADAVDEVLSPDGLQLRPGAADVTYALRCPFDGHVVPHLVVRRPEGSVTVLVLAHRTTRMPIRFRNQGFEGVIRTAPRGAIAIVGSGATDLDAVAQQVIDAVDWGE